MQGEEGAGSCVLHFHGKGGRIKRVWGDGPGRLGAVGSTSEGQQPGHYLGALASGTDISWEGQI